MNDFKDFVSSNWKNRLLFYRDEKFRGRSGLEEISYNSFPCLFFSDRTVFSSFVEPSSYAPTSHNLCVFSSLVLEGSCLRYALGSLSQFHQNSVQMSLSQAIQLCFKSPASTFHYHLLLTLTIPFPYLLKISAQYFSLYTIHIFCVLNTVYISLLGCQIFLVCFICCYIFNF